MSFGLISDTHNHAWRQFATVNSAGVNSRLEIILQETRNAAEMLKKAGADVLLHAGDMFHVRGNIAPSVLNPTLETYRYIVQELGMRVHVIPGNHDLESNHSNFETNASSALKDVGVHIITHPKRVTLSEDVGAIMFPWEASIDQLKADLEALSSEDRSRLYAVIHAPVNGVILGIPDHGLDPVYLKSLGYRGIFSGHYHNRKDFGDNVWSIGALTHQTWGDVGSDCGFLHVTGNVVTPYDSSAPRFVDFDPSFAGTEQELRNMVKGNYVRVKMPIEKDSEIEEFRQAMQECDAAGVTVHPIRKPKNSVRTASIKSGATIEASVAEFIDLKKYTADKTDRLKQVCQEILSLADTE